MGTFLPTWAPLPFWNSLLLFYQPVFNLLLWPALTVTSTQSERRGWGGERENKQKGGWGSAERRGRERIEAGGGAFKKIALCFVGSCWSCSGIAVKLLCGTCRVQVGKEMSGGWGRSGPSPLGLQPQKSCNGEQAHSFAAIPNSLSVCKERKTTTTKKRKKELRPGQGCVKQQSGIWKVSTTTCDICPGSGDKGVQWMVHGAHVVLGSGPRVFPSNCPPEIGCCSLGIQTC